MPKTENDPLGPRFVWRLRFELDRVQPRFSPPRYATRARVSPWRFAPFALAIGITGILGLTAYAATGSANPVVWTERARSVIEAVPLSPTPELTQSPGQPKANPPAAPTRGASPKPSERPEPSGSPEPRESPEPSDGQYGSGSPASSTRLTPAPTPTPRDH